jgi:hypothetical protein
LILEIFKFYLAKGLVLQKKQIRVVEYKQRKWLKEYYTDLNAELRKRAQNGFEKNCLKLVNNSVFCLPPGTDG